jgi:ABC-type Fe3+-hydroxamate transport system substrate-binding protein
MRIVSLVPSLTETIASVPLAANLVGGTNYCVHPKKLNITRIGGTKNPDIEAIRNLRPTHIIANREENRKEDIEVLANQFPVFVSEPQCIQDVPLMLDQMSSFLATEEFDQLSEDIKYNLQNENMASQQFSTINSSALYLIWQNPYMAAGPGTYINSTLQMLGYKNKILEGRYPVVSCHDYLDKDTTLFLSSEPFPFRKRQAEEIRQKFGFDGLIFKIDGKLMSWYGTSTLTFLQALHNQTRIMTPI